MAPASVQSLTQLKLDPEGMQACGGGQGAEAHDAGGA
jgi:hypothetical protein